MKGGPPGPRARRATLAVKTLLCFPGPATGSCWWSPVGALHRLAAGDFPGLGGTGAGVLAMTVNLAAQSAPFFFCDTPGRKRTVPICMRIVLTLKSSPNFHQGFLLSWLTTPFCRFPPIALSLPVVLFWTVSLILFNPDRLQLHQGWKCKECLVSCHCNGARISSLCANGTQDHNCSFTSVASGRMSSSRCPR